ncbi:unnamed protein product, partial [Mesorhabditis belari]|uniref:Osteopetrosis-associated transmembrane protein 1 n=1 Tax=Mesorhabditis belari TaxID=2138241 RepID=A0AAF3F566_9BILA
MPYCWNTQTSVFFLLFVQGLTFSTSPWNLYGACHEYVEKFASVSSEMINCALNYSTPPSVCLHCFDKWFWNITVAGTKCSEVIYNNYVVSYNKEIVQFFTDVIWQKSRCESCFNFESYMQSNDSFPKFSDRTAAIQNKTLAWRSCIDTHSFHAPNESYCSSCKDEFNDMFQYYWEIYTKPGIDFCVDVETQMNDTIHLWGNVWNCPTKDDGTRETNYVVYTFVFLAVTTFLFYGASYAQGERESRRLVQYSRLDPPQGQRSRLLSSASSSNLHVPSNLYNF